MPSYRTSPWHGWRLTGGISIVLLIAAVMVALMAPNAVNGAREVIRLTARSSLVLFLLAFTASSLQQLFPSPSTLWLKENRRYIGVAFAASHAIHAAAIVALARLDPLLFGSITSVGSFIGGGLAYAFIILMTLTSFDRMAALIGSRTWRWLHRAGAWYIWLSFALNFGKRIGLSPFYGVPVGLLALAVAIHIAAAWRRPEASRHVS